MGVFKQPGLGVAKTAGNLPSSLSVILGDAPYETLILLAVWLVVRITVLQDRRFCAW